MDFNILYVFYVIRIIIIFIILNLNLFLRPLNYSLGVTSWCKEILWQLLAHIKRSERWDNFCIDHEYYVIISIVFRDIFVKYFSFEEIFGRILL